jgi:phosphate-selective porin OprO/OprP
VRRSVTRAVSFEISARPVSTVNSTGGFATQPLDEQTGIIGRFAVAPFDTTSWQAHFAVNGQYVTQPNDAGVAATPRYPIQLRDRPELRIDGARLVDTGGIDAKSASVLGGEFAATAQQFFLESEYFQYKIERRNVTALTPSDPHFSGWYVQGGIVLTGENRPYNAGEARLDLRVVKLGEDVASTNEEALACVREVDSTRRTVEQPNAEPRLERRESPAH